MIIKFLPICNIIQIYDIKNLLYDQRGEVYVVIDFSLNGISRLNDVFFNQFMILTSD